MVKTVNSRELQRRRYLALSRGLLLFGVVGLLYLYYPYILAQYEYYQFRQTVQPVIHNNQKRSPEPTFILEAKSETAMVYEKPTLIIPILNVRSPIVQDVDASRQYNYNTALKQGVAHMKGTAALAAPSGNSFIFGHSSRFTSSRTEYDTIFANLDKLRPGDEIRIAHNNQSQRYIVTRSQAVSANDTSVLAETSHKQITLMACWPVGTTFKRWIVQANLEL